MQPATRHEDTDFTHQAANKVIDTASDLANRAGVKIDRALDAANDLAADAAEKGRAAGHQIEAVAGNIKGAVDKSVSEQPMATLAVAAMVGFVVGALWKS